MSLVKKYKNTFMLWGMILFVVLVTMIPYMQEGVVGHVSDMLYHMTRIESVKEALIAGQYPAYVNPTYFGGYGYASSTFYPDVFLIPAALMRMIGISPLVTWKLNILLMVVCGCIITYCSFKYIIQDEKYAMLGTMLLMLSQFYLADIVLRAGLSEYTACMFMPILFAGLYDFFAKEGKKTYLIGIAFVGMVLTHTIMTVLGVVVTVVLFVVALFCPKMRVVYKDKKRISRLVFAAIVSVLTVAYYVFPMFEQIQANDLQFTEPWAFVWHLTQPFLAAFRSTGYFDVVAYVGVGVPFLVLLGCRVIMGKNENKLADRFMLVGVLIVVAMTDLFPWRIIQETFLNMIQFPYRLYPYALCCMTIGLMLYFRDNKVGNARKICIFIAVLAIGGGVIQNVSAIDGAERTPINEKTLASSSFYVGQGEWMPRKFGVDDSLGPTPHGVLYAGEQYEFLRLGHLKYSFQKDAGSEGEYLFPLTYYKGYSAQLECLDGTVIPLQVDCARSEDQVEIYLEDDMCGTITVWYEGTMVQKVSRIISAITMLSVVVYAIVRMRKNKMATER